jgi:hypothetical protein
MSGKKKVVIEGGRCHCWCHSSQTACTQANRCCCPHRWRDVTECETCTIQS